VFALRHVFKEATDQILVANTKGATGHPMAVGIEDVVSVKILETGRSARPTSKWIELGTLNLSKEDSPGATHAAGAASVFKYHDSAALDADARRKETASRPWVPLSHRRRGSLEQPVRVAGYAAFELELFSAHACQDQPDN
jgi:hypothetical protein